MPQLRAPDGSIVSVPDEQAGQLIAGGYEPVTLGEAAQVTAAPDRETSGALAPIGAAASSFLSGASLGLSDLAFKGLLDKASYERLAADREAHPVVSGAGQLAGTLVGGPTPAGALNEATAAASAGRGIGARIAADAAAGSVYSAGAYLSDSALEDRELSAEGLRAALGAGFEFGAAGGAAALGIERGTIAARRLFSRLADGTDRVANEAEQAWRAKHQATLEANDAAAEVARAKLAEAQLARQQAQLAQQRAAAGVADARAGLGGAAPAVPTPGSSGVPSAAPGASAAAPGVATPAAVAAEARPIDEQIAAVMNDRAHVGLQPGVVDPRAVELDQKAVELMAQRPGDVTQVSAAPSFAPGDPGFRFGYSSKGGTGNALDLLAEQPGVLTRGPAELGRIPGSLPNEEELAAALREHDSARKEFLEALSKIDASQPALDRMLAGADPTDLETLLGRVDPDAAAARLERLAPHDRAAKEELGILRGMGGLDVQRPTVSVGEFGAPGARGIKTPDELQRIAEGSAGDGLAPALAPEQPATAVLSGGAKGTPVGAAPEVAQPATAVGKRPVPAVEPAGAPTTGRIEVHDTGGQRMRATMPDGSTVDLGTSGADKFLAEQMPPGFRPAKIQTHQPFVVEHGLPQTAADVAKLDENAIYIAKPSELAKRDLWGNELKDVKRDKVLELWKQGEKLPPVDGYVMPDGRLYIEDGNHRIQAAARDGDRPVAIRFKNGEGYRPQSGAHEIGDRIREDLPKGGGAAPAGDDLLAALSGTKSAIDKGTELADIGGKEAAAARAEQLARHPETAERFLRKAGAADAVTPFNAKTTGADLDEFFKNLTAPKTRDAYVAANIGRAMREEGSHAAALAKVEREWAERAATEAWAERAAVLEYEGGYSRAEAERIARDEVENAARGPGAAAPPVWESKKNLKRVEAAKKAAAASVERLHEIHSAVASNLPQELQTAWNEEGYKFLREESARIRGVKDRIDAASKLSEAFTEKYGAASETGRGYEGDRFHRRAEIEAKHAESWANEQERKYYASAMRDGHPLDIRRLEMAHDAALERAATAAEPTERAAAAQEARAIERELTAVGARPGAVEDVAAAAPVVTRYERASAKLAEVLGDEAPPAAKEAAQAFRAAEDAAERKTIHRATRAIDEHASRPPPTSAAEWNEQQMRAGRPDALAPPPKSTTATNPRIAGAQADKLRADAALAHARAAETEARIGADTAKRTAAEYRTAAEKARPAAAAEAAPSKLGSVLTAVAAAGELGIPGIPHPKDIPVVGPLLSLWTKYRIAKAMMGRFAGRVAATGDARAAAYAAKAKDKVARAVDQTLGLAAEVAPKARAPLVATAAVLGRRLIDDGEPDAKRGASAQELAAVRIREIAAAATRPDLVVELVRKQLGPVTDPDLIAAAEQVLQKQFQYLAGVMPKLPPANPYAKTQFLPSPAAAADLADRIGVMHAPETAFRDPTPAKADAVANFYPKLFAFAQQRLAERAADLEHPMDHRDQLIASLIFRVPVATSMQPGNAAILQSAHIAMQAAMQPQPSAAPTPSVAGPTNLNQLYQTGADRRAAR